MLYKATRRNGYNLICTNMHMIALDLYISCSNLLVLHVMNVFTNGQCNYNVICAVISK